MAAGLDFVLLVWTTTVGEKIGVISREDNDKVFFFFFGFPARHAAVDS